MQINIFLTCTLIVFTVIFFSVNNTEALTIGDYGQSYTVYCKNKQSYKCMVKDSTYYDNRVCYTIDIIPGQTEITEISGTDTASYFYFPDSVNKVNSWGVIDGFVQFFPNDPLASIKVFTDDSSLL